MSFSLRIPKADIGPAILVTWRSGKSFGSMSFNSFRQFGETVSKFKEGVEWSVDPDCVHPMVIAGRELAKALFGGPPAAVASNIVEGVGFGVRAKPGADAKLASRTA